MAAYAYVSEDRAWHSISIVSSFTLLKYRAGLASLNIITNATACAGTCPAWHGDELMPVIKMGLFLIFAASPLASCVGGQQTQQQCKHMLLAARNSRLMLD